MPADPSLDVLLAGLDPADREVARRALADGVVDARTLADAVQAVRRKRRRGRDVSLAEVIRGQSPRPSNRLPVQRFGPFTILETIAEGAMGVVHRARNTDDEEEREVALKILKGGDAADTRAIERFRREARAALALDHPHVVRIHQVGEHKGYPWYSMEFVQGQPLHRLMEEGVPPRIFVSALRDAAHGLHAAHQVGVIHRDVKPPNILVSEADGRAKVTDFGLAKLTEATLLTRSGTVLGTPFYMSPEQAAGRTKEIDRRADVYALGVILYEYLAGEVPFHSDSPEALYREIQEGDPRPILETDPEADPELARVAEKAMALDPADRYPTAGVLADDLERWLEGTEVSARHPGPVSTLARRVRRHGRIVAAGLAFLVLAAAGTAWWVHSSGRAAYAERLASARGRVDTLRSDLERHLNLARRAVEDGVWSRALEALDEVDALLASARTEGPDETALREADRREVARARERLRTQHLFEARSLRGRTYLALQRPRAAAVRYHEAAERAPDAPRRSASLRREAEAWLRADRPDRSLEALERLGAPSPAVRKLRARALLAAGRAPEALSLLEEADEDPALTAVHARTLAALDRVPRALSLLERARGDRPLDPTLPATQAEILAGDGRVAEALALLDSWPGDPGGRPSILLRTRGEILLAADRPALAAADLRRAIDAGAGPASRLALGRARLAAGDLVAAAGILETATGERPEDPVPEVARARRAILAREDPMPHLEEALTRDADHVEAHLLASLVLLDRDGDPAVATSHARRAVESSSAEPARARALAVLCRARLAAEDPEGAGEALRRAVETSPNHPAVLAARALAGERLELVRNPAAARRRARVERNDLDRPVVRILREGRGLGTLVRELPPPSGDDGEGDEDGTREALLDRVDRRLRRAALRDPWLAEARLAIGRFALLRDEAPTAVRSLEIARALDRDLAGAAALLGGIRIWEERTAGRSLLEAALPRSGAGVPAGGRALLFAADQAASAGEPDLAAALLDALGERASEPALLDRAAAVAGRLPDEARAGELAERASAIRDRRERAAALVAEARRMIDEHDDRAPPAARERLERASVLHEDAPALLREWSRLLHQEGRFEEGTAWRTRHVLSDPSELDDFLLGILEYEQVLADPSWEDRLRTWREEGENEAWPHALEAALLHRLGSEPLDAWRALDRIEDAIVRAPASLSARLLRGAIVRDLGYAEAASEELATALQLTESPAVRVHCAAVHARAGDHGRAIDLIREAIDGGYPDGGRIILGAEFQDLLDHPELREVLSR